MYYEPNPEVLRRLDIQDCVVGDSIIFCPGCFWQKKNSACKPICPECETSLHITIVDEELIKLRVEHLGKVALLVESASEVSDLMYNRCKNYAIN